jgi:acetyl esterase
MGRDPEYLAFMRLVERTLADAPEQTVDEERAGHAGALAAIPRPPVAHVEDLKVAGLRARLYHPSPGQALPGLVFFHGGGFHLGTVEGYDPMARVLALATECAVVSVEYRLAPEHPFPAGVEDAVAATVDVADRTAELGIDPDRLGVAGDSAGGNLAAVVALRLRDTHPLALQLLIYGVYDLVTPLERRPDPDGLNISGGDWDTTRGRYLAGADPHHPDASPMLAPDLTGAPPAVVVTAEYDRLCAQGEQYADRLRASGVAVTLVPGTGLDHAFLAWGTFARRPAEAIAEIGATVRTAFRTVTTEPGLA